MIDLYTWKTPNGRKISIMLEEVGLDYEVHPININEGEQHQKHFLKICPNGKIPAIVDQDNGKSLFESGAILIYLAEKTKQLLPANDYWDIIQWLMWQMANVGPMFGQTHHFLKHHPDASTYSSARYHKETLRLYQVLDDHLSENNFMASNYSIADIAIWPWVARFGWHQMNFSDYPHVHRWYLEIASRPSVQKGYDVPSFGEEVPLPTV